ncbi:MAG: 30S ribosomal protein S20 [Patescibacteria group bacterium]
MPNKPSAAKELRKAKKRTVLNRRTESHVRNLFKMTMDLIKEGKMEEASKFAQRFQQAIDKAVKNEVESKNKASRKKSSLMKAMKKSA